MRKKTILLYILNHSGTCKTWRRQGPTSFRHTVYLNKKAMIRNIEESLLYSRIRNRHIWKINFTWFFYMKVKYVQLQIDIYELRSCCWMGLKSITVVWMRNSRTFYGMWSLFQIGNSCGLKCVKAAGSWNVPFWLLI